MTTYLDLQITVMLEGQESAAQVIVAVIEEGKDYRSKRFNNIVMIAKPLTYLLALINFWTKYMQHQANITGGPLLGGMGGRKQ